MTKSESMIDEALRDLIEISRAVGEDRSLVQGGGGNTSVKAADGEWMYIKASGTAIKDLDERRGWCRLKVDAVRAILRDPALAELEEAARELSVVDRLRACRSDEAGAAARPSVESHLHALLGRCVVHLHPVAVGAYVCAKQGREALEALFAGDDPPPVWVPYTNPGYLLARKVSRVIDSYRRRYGAAPRVMFLQKHGLLVTAEEPEEVLALVRRVIETCSAGLPPRGAVRPAAPAAQDITAAQRAVRRAVWEATGQHTAVRQFLDDDLAWFLAHPEAARLASLPPLTPDELAYGGNSALWVDQADASAIARRLKRQMARGERPSASFLMKDVGLLVSGTDRTIPIIRDVVTAALLVRGYATAAGGPNPLTKAQRAFVARWEGERYRRELATGAQEGELCGYIALVTGAGSGLGRSIAIGLGRAGALVALVDIDVAGAEQTRDLIAREAPSASSFAVRCDVTQEGDVAAAYQAVQQRWGGLDILVNAAGIAPPYSLVDLPLEKWRAALEVNLTGYFLMAREAARIMIEQGMGGSIINLSSKSGLQASRDNTAYNATKAAEIHMARGWALELGEHGIRVNSVAPGNVFEGSKIWNEEYIRACARKYGIRPEQVIPYYINMTALKRDIKGQDVADAVVFLCSERARTITGQTLVPDGGQVMVR